MKRIAFIGPESTGKSSLCARLAESYQSTWVPEYARDYIGGLDRPYSEEDVGHCIKRQFEELKKAESGNPELIFTDNEGINGMVWMLDKFNFCPQWIISEIDNNPFDLYLLTYPDLPFIPDPVRENENRRMYFFDWYEKELRSRKLNYVIIRGVGETRFLNAKNAVEEFLSGK